MFHSQVTIAAKLAHSHSHGWAIRRTDWSVPISEDESLCEGRLPRTIEEAAVASAWSASEPMPGITYQTDEDGGHRHTTGSGRLKWSVDRRGGWRIWVLRPGDRIVILVEGDARGNIEDHEVRGYYYLRHVEALATALRAVAPAQADSLVARLLLGIPDSEAIEEHERLERYTADRREYEPGYRGPAIAPLLAARARRASVRVLPGESLEAFCARRAAS